jgi:hypothetical protein
MNKMRAVVILCVLNGLMSVAFASTVHLKNGSSVEGAIIEQNNQSIKINIDGVGMTYYADEIQDIDGKALAAAPAAGQTAGSPAENSDKRALILKLMEITGTKQRLAQTLDFIKKGMPPQAVEVMDKAIKIDELLEKLVPIYDRNLSAEELQGLINFYDSDLGRKYILVTPVIMKESMQVGQDYVRGKVAQLRNDEKNQTP